MEQRRLRLGDILDDYCPRERRVTNHAVVAMIEDAVKQTRCTTCDAEHAYKGGKAPRTRKKDSAAALYKEVLAGMTDEAPTLAVPAQPEPAPVAAEEVRGEADAASLEAEPGDRDDADRPGEVEEGPVHRPLIRATLPRPEGQKDARPIPEFTVRHSGNRPGGNRSRGPGGNGFRAHGGGQRFGGQRGNGRGPGGRPAGGGGFRSPQQPRHGGRKRSR